MKASIICYDPIGHPRRIRVRPIGGIWLSVGVNELVCAVVVGSVLNKLVDSLKLLIYARVCRFEERPYSRVVDHVYSKSKLGELSPDHLHIESSFGEQHWRVISVLVRKDPPLPRVQGLTNSQKLGVLEGSQLGEENVQSRTELRLQSVIHFVENLGDVFALDEVRGLRILGQSCIEKHVQELCLVHMVDVHRVGALATNDPRI